MGKNDTRVARILKEAALVTHVNKAIDDARICTEADFRHYVARHLIDGLEKFETNTPWRVHLELSTKITTGDNRRPDMLVSSHGNKVEAAIELKVFPKSSIPPNSVAADLKKLEQWTQDGAKIVVFMYIQRLSAKGIKLPRKAWITEYLINIPIYVDDDSMDRYLRRWPFQDRYVVKDD